MLYPPLDPLGETINDIRFQTAAILIRCLHRVRYGFQFADLGGQFIECIDYFGADCTSDCDFCSAFQVWMLESSVCVSVLDCSPTTWIHGLVVVDEHSSSPKNTNGLFDHGILVMEFQHCGYDCDILERAFVGAAVLSGGYEFVDGFCTDGT